MLYEVHGTDTKTGKPVKVHVKADSPEAAIARAAKHQITVDPSVKPSLISPPPTPQAPSSAEKAARETPGPEPMPPGPAKQTTPDSEDVARVPVALFTTLGVLALIVIGGTLWWLRGELRAQESLGPASAATAALDSPDLTPPVTGDVRSEASNAASPQPETRGVTISADELYMRALAHEDGVGVPQSDQTAVELYTKAAEAGSVPAMYKLGLLITQWNDDADRILWLQKAAERGHSSAMVSLGTRYGLGHQVPEDLKQAVDWYRRAAEAGNPSGMRLLAESYERGRGVDLDIAKAVQWYDNASDLNDARSVIVLASMSDELLEDARLASSGDSVGMVNLGVYYTKGELVDKDLALATSWYARSAQAGNVTGMYYLAMNHEAGDGTPKDDTAAMRWYRAAAEKGHAKCMFKVGELFYNGRGVAKSPSDAALWWRRAADAGVPAAMVNLGSLYIDGDGVPRSASDAAAWWRRGADAGMPSAMVLLGTLYLDGDGVEKNRAEAIRWIRKAHEAGLKEAAAALRKLGEVP